MLHEFGFMIFMSGKGNVVNLALALKAFPGSDTDYSCSHFTGQRWAGQSCLVSRRDGQLEIFGEQH